ncbi:aminodeoxychorismate synthase [Exophiala mesophila]|uniref:aminodeoxychorismate synthase n=1 Tax=Exophiala mesophila TaxID=212818 RepID=A0A0D1XTY7_EXOME|nr:aminodeoxychorismate synthase [Exophiala mesophila]KIV91651.1 aminodeoxychorismate synthase [Exophiala mesophila]
MTTDRTVLFVDAYDSFAENIAALLQQKLHVTVTLIHIDCDIPARFGLSVEEFLSTFDAIVLGPGPGNPQNESDVGLFNTVWKCSPLLNIPVLGICLGFQSLCINYGLPVVKLGLPCHGHAKAILHTDSGIFNGAGNVVATNYNSLGVRRADMDNSFVSRTSSSGSVVSLSSSRSFLSDISTHDDSVSRCRDRKTVDLTILAWDTDNWVMAVKHNLHHFHGFQFHPESCKSNEACVTLLKNWWDSAALHNERYRVNCGAKTLAIQSHSSSQMEKGPIDTEYLRLQTRLGHLGRHIGQDLHFVTLSSIEAHDEIAQLCYDMSGDDNLVMLESTRKGRYSIFPFPDESTFRLEYGQSQCKTVVGSSEQVHRLPRQAVVTLLEWFLLEKQYTAESRDVPFTAGFMGYLSYEFGIDSLNMETSASHQASSPRSTSDISLAWVDRSIVVDHHTQTVHIQSLRKEDGNWCEEMARKIKAMTAPTPDDSPSESNSLLREIQQSSQFHCPDHDSYISQIQQCRAQLIAGNSYELCLTTEASITTPKGRDHAWILYRNLQRHNPVPYAGYVRLGGTTILSSSPEHFISWTPEGTIDMMPMKGTVKKSRDMTFAKAKEILASAKESAENLMIADLIRHDLYSTVSRDALVQVVKLCDVIETETVYTMISHVRAHVPLEQHNNDKDKNEPTESTSHPSRPSSIQPPHESRNATITRYGLKSLTRTLPPGSMTGAPKKRSCEILAGLERRHRGIYSGAIGYMDVGGFGSWNVCIRTAFANDSDDQHDDNGRVWQKWRIGAGGAITVLSDDESEWDEMMTKLDSVVKAFQSV